LPLTIEFSTADVAALPISTSPEARAISEAGPPVA
jgi:hypothetical protein